MFAATLPKMTFFTFFSCSYFQVLRLTDMTMKSVGGTETWDM